MQKTILVLTAALLVLAPALARADDNLTLTIKDHVFSPAEIKVKANTRVELTVINDDATPEEFDSKALKVEKVIAGKSKASCASALSSPGVIRSSANIMKPPPRAWWSRNRTCSAR